MSVRVRSRLVPFMDGAVAVSLFRLTPRERATLALSQIANDAGAQDYRRWRRIGAANQAGIFVLEIGLLAFTCTALPPLAASFIGILFLTFEVVIQHRTRSGLRRVAIVCESTADTA